MARLVGYDVLKHLVVTSKATKAYRQQRKLTFRVASGVTKPMVADAVEKLWPEMKVLKVAIINLPAKVKRFKKTTFIAAPRKKAIVTVAGDLPQANNNDTIVPAASGAQNV